MPLLEIKDMTVAYGRIEALHGISLTVEEGELVTLIGANGAGKTTTMRAISGIRPLTKGSIFFDGQDITKMKAHLRVIAGIVQAPEGRGVFPGVTNVSTATQIFTNESQSIVKSSSFFVQEEFLTLAERLLLTAGVNSERTSNNGDAQKYYAYPKFSASYRMPTPSMIDELKLRLAYGRAGNFPTAGNFTFAGSRTKARTSAPRFTS